MSSFADSTKKITIDTVLPDHSSFQESLDTFVSEFECRFNHFGGRIRDWQDDDYVMVSARADDTFSLDFSADSWEWF
jgi:hypothetical protein